MAFVELIGKTIGGHRDLPSVVMDQSPHFYLGVVRKRDALRLDLYMLYVGMESVHNFRLEFDSIADVDDPDTDIDPQPWDFYKADRCFFDCVISAALWVTMGAYDDYQVAMSADPL